MKLKSARAVAKEIRCDHSTIDSILNTNGIRRFTSDEQQSRPIYLTKNGQGELVVMDIESFEKREQELRAQQMVLESYAARLSGSKDYSLEESKSMMENMLKGDKQ